MRILILGVTGMIGHTMFRVLSKNKNFNVFGTARTISGIERFFTDDELGKIRRHVDSDNFDTVARAIAALHPDVMINCIGTIKQLPMASDPLTAITNNAQLPHRLSMLARIGNSRLIQFSTDCVFSGQKGEYVENDHADATDLYGQTKYLGEVCYPHCITLRTSFIGHELTSSAGLVEWFLRQGAEAKGFTRAYYTGLPTCEIANVVEKFVIPNRELNGLFHLSGDKISKYDLLNLIRDQYKKKIKIEPFSDVFIDRSLNSDKFRSATGYTPPSWSDLVKQMYEDFQQSDFYRYSFYRNGVR